MKGHYQFGNSQVENPVSELSSLVPNLRHFSITFELIKMKGS